MRPSNSIAFRASRSAVAEEALDALQGRYGQADVAAADVVVALGGDGFMLETLKEVQTLGKPVYGMNRGTVGFLMNEYSDRELPERLSDAEEAVINPLRMRAGRGDGSVVDGLAINEVSLLRQGPQAARLRITVDNRARLEELVCDGALVSTPAGSTAYNYSAHGP
ncbi:MAG: NAD kinase, partial [Pseudomonadota bacterium]